MVPDDLRMQQQVFCPATEGSFEQTNGYRSRKQANVQLYIYIFSFQYRRVQSAEMLPQGRRNADRSNKNEAGPTAEQQRIVASARAQFERRGGFVRIFPSPKSWELYSQYLGKSSSRRLAYIYIYMSDKLIYS